MNPTSVPDRCKEVQEITLQRLKPFSRVTSPVPVLAARQPEGAPWPLPSIPTGPKARTPQEVEAATKVGGVMENDDYLVLALRARVYDVAVESPLELATINSKALGSQIYFKREDAQGIFSFKCRGSFNKMTNLTEEERSKGVIAVSAGNHAQGVALAARKLGIKATICMPMFAPQIKVNGVRRLGAEVILCGDDFDTAKQEMLKIASKRSLVVVPPFDDPHVIAGQATVGVEILRQIRQDRLDAIFVCMGGGGLIAGIAAYIKRIRPDIRIIGVNSVDSDSMLRSLNAGEPVTIPTVGLFADGTAVRRVGNETFRICQALLDDIIVVTTDEICAAIKSIHEEIRVLVEPSGALAFAGCRRFLENNPGLSGGAYACVISGANMNFDRLRFVVERARIGARKEALVLANLPERPGALKSIYDIISPRAITEMAYRYTGPPHAHLLLGFELTGEPSSRQATCAVPHAAAGISSLSIKETASSSNLKIMDCCGNGSQASIAESCNSIAPTSLTFETEVAEMLQDLAANGVICKDVTDCELAKTHARFLVGGRRMRSTNGQNSSHCSCDKSNNKEISNSKTKNPVNSEVNNGKDGTCPFCTPYNERLYRVEFPERPGNIKNFLYQLRESWNITLLHYRNHGADTARVLIGMQVPPGEEKSFTSILDAMAFKYYDETENQIFEDFLR